MCTMNWQLHTININGYRSRCSRLTYSLLLTFHCPRLPYTLHLMLRVPSADAFHCLLLLPALSPPPCNAGLELSGSVWCNCWSAAGEKQHSLVKVHPLRLWNRAVAFSSLSSPLLLDLQHPLHTPCTLAWQRTSGIISRGRGGGGGDGWGARGGLDVPDTGR